VNDQVGIETIRLLIEKFVCFFQNHFFGWIQLKILSNSISIVFYRGANVNQKNLGREGTTPLHIAAFHEDLDVWLVCLFVVHFYHL
jgi:hypothetical protein